MLFSNDQAGELLRQVASFGDDQQALPGLHFDFRLLVQRHAFIVQQLELLDIIVRLYGLDVLFKLLT